MDPFSVSRTTTVDYVALARAKDHCRFTTFH